MKVMFCIEYKDDHVSAIIIAQDIQHLELVSTCCARMLLDYIVGAVPYHL